MLSSTLPTSLSIEPTDARLGNTTWFYLWSIGALNECLCARGSFHRTTDHDVAVGGSADCGSGSGKHPFTVWKDGEVTGFRHGAADALPYQELIATYGESGGRRRLAMCLNDVIMIDIDSERALLSFYRFARHVPLDKIIGIARTPRGWHIYLHCPEWTQKAATIATREWLGDWDGVDAKKVSRRGLLIDIRTGPNRYTVWPGKESRDRRWVPFTEFRDQMMFAGRGMPRDRMVQDGSLAPWNRVMNDDLRERIKQAGTDNKATRPALKLDGSAADMALAWREFERWASMLDKMGPESGRNNALNTTAYHSGADAIAAGHSEERVRARLLAAATRNGTPGAEATITSGLTSGLRDHHDIG